MSRVGSALINFDSTVKIKQNRQLLSFEGKLGSSSLKVANDINVKISDNTISVEPVNLTKKTKALWGTMNRLIANCIQGVSLGHKKILEINGVGFKSDIKDGFLNLYLGYSHNIKYKIPSGIDIKALKPTVIEVSGIDKQLVGQVCSTIKALRVVEPYRQKGIKEQGQRVIVKEGKKK